MADLKGAEYVSSKAGDTIAIVGDLCVRQFEGGFSADGFWVGAHDISQLIATLFGLEIDNRGSLGNLDLGRVKLTISRLKD